MSDHRPHPTYAIANIDGLPDHPAVFELLGVNQNDNSYIATCVSVAGVVCKPGHLAADHIIARFASRETAFTVLAERVSNLKGGAVAAASHPAFVEATTAALADQHELPGIPAAINPAPVEATAQMLADVPIMRFFHYAHLPDALREVSKPFAELALSLVNKLPPNAERSVALRKLLEAKDAAVRASLPTGYGEKI